MLLAVMLLALMLLAVRLVKLPIGDVTDVVPCNVLPLIALLALMLLAVKLVKLPIGDVIDVVPRNVLPLIVPLALMLLAVIFNPDPPNNVAGCNVLAYTVGPATYPSLIIPSEALIKAFTVKPSTAGVPVCMEIRGVLLLECVTNNAKFDPYDDNVLDNKTLFTEYTDGASVPFEIV